MDVIDKPALDTDKSKVVTPEMAAAASEVLMSFYIGGGIHDLRDPCLTAIYLAMSEVDGKAFRP
jgi:hypothetical protein